MSTTTRTLRTLLTRRSHPRPQAEQDPADMGTCFGLEMTLAPMASELPPPAALPPTWWQRLSPRKIGVA